MSVPLSVFDTPEEVARRAADFIEAKVREKPDLRVLVATGDTPMRTYRELARRNPDLREVWAVQLDEYLGVSDDDPRSLYGWMARSFVEPLGVGHVLRFDPRTDDPECACDAYAREVQELGGIDLAILGLGPNGHLGFNEPPSGADAPTRVVTLSEASLKSNAAYWEGLEVPRQALTVGMDLILGAKRCLLIVTGAHKRDILRRTLQGSVTPDVPASYLQGANLMVVADEAAAS